MGVGEENGKVFNIYLPFSFQILHKTTTRGKHCCCHPTRHRLRLYAGSSQDARHARTDSGSYNPSHTRTTHTWPGYMGVRQERRGYISTVGRGYLRTRGGRSTKVANAVLAFAFCLDKTRVTRNGEPSHLLRGKTRQPSSRCARYVPS